MIFRLSILIVLFGQAQLPAAEHTLSVESAAAFAVRNNPSLAAARLRIEEARGRLDGSGRRSNPELEFEFRQNPRDPERSFGLSWMQRYPVTARLQFEKAVHRAELAAAEAEVRDAERRLAGEVRVAAVSILALEKERALRRQQIANSDELAAFLKKRVELGEAPAVDAAQVDLETRELRNQTKRLDAEKVALLGAFRPLLGIKARDNVSIAGALQEPTKAISKTGDTRTRGDFAAAQAMAEVARQNVELVKANKWADIGVGFSLEHERTQDAPAGFSRDTMIGFKLSMPLPLKNSNDGAVREAVAASRRSGLELDALRAQIRAEADAAKAEIIANANVVADFDENLIPQAEEIEQQLQKAYTAGQVSLAEVTRARGRRFELESQRLDALRDYHIARAKYQTAVGNAPVTNLEKRK
jgi:outer membrane protein, heavy metal efflux system